MTGSTSYAREQIEGHPIRKGDSHKHPRATRCPLRAGYGLAAGLVGLFLFASGVPSALYGTYQQLWGFSPLVLTLVYATYAFGVLTMLVLAASPTTSAAVPSSSPHSPGSWPRPCSRPSPAGSWQGSPEYGWPS